MNRIELEQGIQSRSAPLPIVVRKRGWTSSTLFWWLVLVAAAGTGLIERLWYVFHRPITSDEAITGLMASQAWHGHFFAFYWGQVYGGTLETLVEAPVLALAGHSSVALSLVPVGLEAVAGLLTWRIAARLTEGRWIPLLAAAVAWVGPQLTISQTSYEFGYRGVVMVCGLILLLIAVRAAGGKRGLGEFAGFGVAAGFGWWSSPEIVYFALPAVAILVEAIRSDQHRQRLHRWVPRLGLMSAAAVVSALPWLWVNIPRHLTSLRTSSFIVPPGAPGYGGRIALFWKYTLPMLYSLRAAGSGEWLIHSAVHDVVFLGLLVLFAIGVALGLRRGGPARVIVLASVAFPFLMCLSPGTWYWQDGRYAVFETPLLALVAAIGCNEAAHLFAARTARRSRSDMSAAGAVLGIFLSGWAALSIWNQASFTTPAVGASWWSDPDGPTYRSAAALVRAGVRSGFADYWVAYDLDFLSGQRLHLTVAKQDVLRWVSEDRIVRASGTVSWLFPAPNLVALTQLSSSAGPGGISEQAFYAYLTRAGIPSRTVRTSVVDAVILPRQLSPETVLAAQG